MGWSEDRWMATWEGPGIQVLYKCLFLGTEQHHNGPFDCSQTGWALRHPRIFMILCHLRGSQLPLGNGRHAKTQALPWTHGQEGTQQLTEAQQSMHQPSSTPYIGNAQTGCNTKVPSDMCTWWCSSAWTQDAPNNVPWGLSHDWVVMRWGEDEHKCAKCTVTQQQILGWEHTWTAQKSPERHPLSVADNTRIWSEHFNTWWVGQCPLWLHASTITCKMCRSICNFPLQHNRSRPEYLLCWGFGHFHHFL